MTKTYTVTTVSTDETDRIVCGDGQHFADIGKAFAAAKRLARTRKDCVHYGPTSVAFVGRDVTAVVAW